MDGILQDARTSKSTLPGRLPTWSILTVILALAVEIAVGMYHWRKDTNGLQRWYFTSYVRSSISESDRFRFKGPRPYQVIDLVDDRDPEQTLTTVTDEDAAVTANKDGTLTLKYTEKWAHREHLRAVVRTIAVDADIMHGWLQEKVYAWEDVGSLLKSPLERGVLAAGMLLLTGPIVAVQADRRRAEQRRMSSRSELKER
jgi:hypothetical protein